jgi:hypothetical protein
MHFPRQSQPIDFVYLNFSPPFNGKNMPGISRRSRVEFSAPDLAS